MAKGMVNINIKVDAKGAVRDINLVGNATKRAGQDAKSWAKAGFFASVGAKAFNLSLGLLKKALSTIAKPIKDSIFEMGVLGDKIAKQSRMIGVTAEQFQVMEYAATRSGTSLTAVTNGMKKLGRVMVDAQNGSRQIKDTFDALGITLQKDNGTLRETFDVFLDVADKSMILGASAERTGVQMLLLGRSGTEMANLFDQGAKGILDLKDELVDLDAIMGRRALSSAENFVDKMADLEHAFRGVKIELGEHLMPEFSLFVGQFTTWLATADFSRVRELANDFFDAAMGVARFADMVFKLELFPEGEEDRLLVVSNRAEFINKRIEEGTANYDDLHRALTLVSSASETTYGGMKRTMENVPLEQFAVQIGEMVGPLEASNASAFRLREEFQLTGEQVEVFTFLHQELGGTLQEAADQMMDLNQISTIQAQLLMLSAASASEYEAAQTTLNKSFRGAIDLETELAARERDRLKRIEAERTALRLRVAQMEKDRLAREAANRDRDAAAKSELDFEKMTEGALAARLAGLAAYKAAALDLFNAFDRIDADQVTADFEAGLIRQNEFMELMGEAANQIVREQFEERKEIITQAHNEGVIGGLEANALLAEADRIRHDDRVRMEEEYWAIANERQLQGMAAYGQVLGAMSNMFGAFSDLVVAGYGEDTVAAKRAANAMFVMQKALAIGQATVQTAVSITNALATPPAPLGIALAVANGIAGAAAIASIVATTVSGVADAGLPPGALKQAGLNQHSLIAMRNDEMILDPVGTKHITEMLMAQKAQMTGGTEEQVISTTVELDGQVLGSAVDKRLIRQAERGIPYTGRIRQGYMAI